jgi:hypothetical protein
MDFSKDDQNTLCDTCKRLCRGHWRLKYYYEHPPFPSRWVQVESRDEDIVVEPRHHALEELQVSVQEGCRLCGIILGTLSQDDITVLSTTGRSLGKTPSTTYELKPWGLDVIITLDFHSNANFHSATFDVSHELLLTPVGGELCCSLRDFGFYSPPQSNVSNTMQASDLTGNFLR